MQTTTGERESKVPKPSIVILLSDLGKSSFLMDFDGFSSISIDFVGFSLISEGFSIRNQPRTCQNIKKYCKQVGAPLGRARKRINRFRYTKKLEIQPIRDFPRAGSPKPVINSGIICKGGGILTSLLLSILTGWQRIPKPSSHTFQSSHIGFPLVFGSCGVTTNFKHMQGEF